MVSWWCGVLVLGLRVGAQYSRCCWTFAPLWPLLQTGRAEKFQFRSPLCLYPAVVLFDRKVRSPKSHLTSWQHFLSAMRVSQYEQRVPNRSPLLRRCPRTPQPVKVETLGGSSRWVQEFCRKPGNHFFAQVTGGCFAAVFMDNAPPPPLPLGLSSLFFGCNISESIATKCGENES